MEKHLFLILTFLIFTFQAISQNRKIEYVLRQLDQVVAMDPIYTSRKQTEIQRLKNNLKLAVQQTDRYLSSKQIAHAYSHFCSDSALVYYQYCDDYGKKNDNLIWIQDASIHQAFVLADRGDSNLAFDRLYRLGDIEQVYPELRSLYAEAMMMGYVRTTSDTFKHFSTIKAKETWEIYGKFISIENPYYYLYYMAANPDFDSEQIGRKIVDQLKKTPEDAMLRMLLGICYQSDNKNFNAIEQFALSAISNIKYSNKNSSSLIMLLAELNNQENLSKQLARLIKYAEISSDNASMYNDPGRSIRLITAQKEILKKYQVETDTQKRNQILLNVVITLSLVLSIFLIWRLYKQNKTIKEQSLQLKKNMLYLEEDINGKSMDMDDKDKKITELLVNKRKFDIVLTQQFGVLSKILSDIKGHKKEIANYLHLGRMAEVRKLVKDNVIKDQTSIDFCKIFDINFLTVHPDFPARLNAILHQNSQLNSEKEGTLSPEQRIYALISLGVDDSKNIAEILHYSIQTVYNYRMKVRHSSLHPSLKIDEYIANLYNSQMIIANEICAI